MPTITSSMFYPSSGFMSGSARPAMCLMTGSTSINPIIRTFLERTFPLGKRLRDESFSLLSYVKLYVIFNAVKIFFLVPSPPIIPRVFLSAARLSQKRVRIAGPISFQFLRVSLTDSPDLKGGRCPWFFRLFRIEPCFNTRSSPG